jgi:hypothetical protein
MPVTVVEVRDPILQATVRIVLQGKLNTPDMADVMSDFFGEMLGYEIKICPVQNHPVLDEIELMLAHQLTTKFAEYMEMRTLN